MEPQEWFYSETEGVINEPCSDKLMNFFTRYNMKSKRSICQKLQSHKIDYDELIQYEEHYLQTTFSSVVGDNPSILEPLELTRLFLALQANPESAIFKEKEKEKKKLENTEVIVITISNQEQKAIDFIETTMETNNIHIQDLNDTHNNKLNKILKDNTLIIESLFEDIITTATKQKNQLIQELNTRINDKQYMIQSQMTQLKERQKSLNEWYQQSQYLRTDNSLDAKQRKHRILSLYVNVLDCKRNSSSVTETDVDMDIHKLQNDIDSIMHTLMQLNAYNDDCMNAKDEFVDESVLSVPSDDIRTRSENSKMRSESQSTNITDTMNVLQEKRDQQRCDNIQIRSESVSKSTNTKTKDRVRLHRENGNIDQEWQTKSKKRRKRKRNPIKTSASKPKPYSVAAIKTQRTVKQADSIVVKNHYQQHEHKREPVVDSWFERNHDNNDNDGTFKYKNIRCKFYTRDNYCNNGKNCRYAHGLKELKRYNPNAKKQPCSYLERGQQCPMNDICNYIHPNDKK